MDILKKMMKMFKLVKISTLSLLLSTCSLFAHDNFAKDWTKYNTMAEISWLLINSIDINQTKQFRYGPNGDSKEWQYYEINPLVGKHPSNKKLNRLWILGSVAHVGISMALPKRYRGIWQGASIVLSSSAVLHNYNLGFKVKF